MVGRRARDALLAVRSREVTRHTVPLASDDEHVFRLLDQIRTAPAPAFAFVLARPRYTLLDPLRLPGERLSATSRQVAVQDSRAEPERRRLLFAGRRLRAPSRPSSVGSSIGCVRPGEVGDILLLVAAAGALFWARTDARAIAACCSVPALVVVWAVPQGYLMSLAGGEAVAGSTGSRWSPRSRCESGSGSCSRSPPTRRSLPGRPPRCATRP